jgi:hypothetical protein
MILGNQGARTNADGIDYSMRNSTIVIGVAD